MHPYQEMLRQCVQQPLVMGIALHPCIVGQPHRLHHLRKVLQHLTAQGASQGVTWWTTPGRICDSAELALGAGRPQQV